MATRIIEYGFPVELISAYPIVRADHQNTAQTPITATGTSAQSSAMQSSTTMVCVQSDEAVYVKLSTNPTATTSDYRIQAGQEQCFAVPQNRSWKVAVRT